MTTLTKKQKEVLDLMNDGWELKEITYIGVFPKERHLFRMYKFRGIQGHEIKRVNPKIVAALVRKQYIAREERIIKFKRTTI
jgi:hypothetical protein